MPQQHRGEIRTAVQQQQQKINLIVFGQETNIYKEKYISVKKIKFTVPRHPSRATLHSELCGAADLERQRPLL